MMQPQVIFLNGPSSSGKSSLALTLQKYLEKPYLYIAEDMLFRTLPARNYARADYLRYGGRLYNGFTQCVRTLVECENRVIVDTVAWVPGSLVGFVEALWETQVFAVKSPHAFALMKQRLDADQYLAKLILTNESVHDENRSDWSGWHWQYLCLSTGASRPRSDGGGAWQAAGTVAAGWGH